MKLYLLRHGRTLWNEAGRLQGRTDVPLSAAGRESARKTAELLADLPLSAAFSSPLSRARETAELIAGGRIPVRTDARLLELSFGAAEGMCILGLQREERPTFRLFSDPEHYVPPEGGESYRALCRRCKDFLREVILPREQDWEHVLIVAHGGTVRGLFSAMFGARAQEIYGSHVQKNCAVNRIACAAGAFFPEQIARDYCEEV